MAYKTHKILVIIPARGGSKRLPGKNIKKISGKPMIAHAILAAKESKYVDRIIVSTDDPAIAKVAKKYGAEIPFIRPAELASDTATTLPVLQHAVAHMESHDKFKPDLVVLIQPTNPLVRSEDIDGAIKKIITTKTNSCFTVSEISQRPEWMYHIDNKQAKLFLNEDSGPTKRSQELPRLAIINGTVYIMRYDTLMKNNLIRDNANTSIYLMPKERSVDIDDLFDFKIAETLMKYDDKKK
ncbi:MAG: acylneuraminate cytidylyltransferase family protein [Candidatus Taylorbacteria bacterium]|nr:acylneuraminate cytidylyltransferase family protein [Candidatus Taylorbacteria bacterium]